MEFKATVKGVSVTESNSEKSYYYLTIKTYKDVFEGKFERSELRHLISIIDQAI